MNPKCNACGADADVCKCFPAYSGNGTAETQVTERYPAAFAQQYAGGAWAVLVPCGAFNERIGEGTSEDEAWEAAAASIQESAKEDEEFGEYEHRQTRGW